MWPFRKRNPPAPPTPKWLLLTITETAEFLGCSEANVYALIDAGKLPIICTPEELMGA